MPGLLFEIGFHFFLPGLVSKLQFSCSASQVAGIIGVNHSVKVLISINDYCLDPLFH
jgi:hypothetical protein